MTTEIWVAAAAILLVIAIAAQGLALFRVHRRWDVVALCARLGVILALAVALVLVRPLNVGWSYSGQRQVYLGLAWTISILQVVLLGRSGVRGFAPVADLISLALIATGALAIRPDALLHAPIQPAAVSQIEGALLLLGVGSTVVAGSAGLVLAVVAVSAARTRQAHLPHHSGLHILLKEATCLALVALGGGLAVCSWWAWQALGTVSSGEIREIWMTITWLLMAMSLVAHRLDRHWGRWTAVLAVSATATALFGLLAAGDLYKLLGI